MASSCSGTSPKQPCSISADGYQKLADSDLENYHTLGKIDEDKLCTFETNSYHPLNSDNSSGSYCSLASPELEEESNTSFCSTQSTISTHSSKECGPLLGINFKQCSPTDRTLTGSYNTTFTMPSGDTFLAVQTDRTKTNTKEEKPKRNLQGVQEPSAVLRTPSPESSPEPETAKTPDFYQSSGKERVDGPDKESKKRKRQLKSDDDDDEEAVYEVEKIVDYVKEDNVDWYLVKWKGWDSDSNTWEPRENLDNCLAVLWQFYQERKLEKQQASSYKRKKLMTPPDPRTVQMKKEQFIKEIFHPTPEAVLMLFCNLRNNKKAEVFKLEHDKVLHQVIERELRNRKQSKKAIKFILDQLMLRELRKKRKEQKGKLRAWQDEMNRISNYSAPILVENEVDLEGPPENFHYINDYVAGENITIPDDPLVGCDCDDCKGNAKNCCASQSGSRYAYNANQRLRVPVGTPIYECNKRCSCDLSCPNRVVQRGRVKKLCIFRTANGCGWGVKTLDSIKKNSFVLEYVGEVITSEEAERRGEKYDAEGRTYLFDLDMNEGEQCPYTVDAAYYGNVSHFINHACEPNLVVYSVWINCLDPNIPRLALFACRDIKKGEEITFDYMSQSIKNVVQQGEELNSGFQMASPSRVGQTATSDKDEVMSQKNSTYISPVLPKKKGRCSQVECKCGAKTCRKYLF